MLDKELVVYLRKHPDVFSRVLAHVLGDDSLGGVPSFQVKHKDWNPRLPELWKEVLIDDMHELIITKLLEDMEHDERVLFDLILLGVVDKGLNSKVKKRLRQLETRIDFVPLLCRALFEYTGQMEIFRIFLARVEDYAPATAAAWHAMSDASIYGDVHRVVTFLQTNRPDRFAAALESNGLDPVATALCMNYMVDPLMRFGKIAFARLSALAIDEVWAWGLMPVGDLPMMVPDVVNLDRIAHICIIRAELAGTPQQRKAEFITMFRWFLDRFRRDDDRLDNVRKELWKRLARIDADLLIEAVVSWRVHFRDEPYTEECVELVYQWFKHVLPAPSPDSDLPIDLVAEATNTLVAFANAMRPADLVMDDFVFILRDAERAKLRYLCRFTKVRKWKKIFREIPTDVLKDLSIKVLLQAIHCGNEALVAFWFQSLWPAHRDSLPQVAKFANALVVQVTQFKTMAKHPASAAHIQDHVADFLEREVHNFRTLVRTWAAFECVGLRLRTYLERAGPDAVSFKKACVRYEILMSQTLAEVTQSLQSHFGETPDAESLHQIISIGVRFSQVRPDLLRHVYNYVLEKTLALHPDLHEGIVRRFATGLTSRTDVAAWHFYQSSLFDQHASPDTSAYLLRQCGKKALALARRLLQGVDETDTVRMVATYLRTRQEDDGPDLEFVKWNLAYLCVSLPSYATLRRRAFGMDEDDGKEEEEVDEEMQNFHHDMQFWPVSTKLERLYLASEHGVFDDEYY